MKHLKTRTKMKSPGAALEMEIDLCVGLTGLELLKCRFKGIRPAS